MAKLLACPDCGGTSWFNGPRGGLAQNIECATCGSQFNDLLWFGLERIGPPAPRLALND